ncbi:MAG: hypothetical protein KA419_12390 [Acidobacteria bacterium]|nr:hypothetical protein [Acidobacteriota bacterium]
MNAEPLLRRIARVFHEARLEAVMVGNAAAALMGAPVTTLDIDFMFRKTPANLKKLKALADRLGGRVLRPYYPASSLYRVVNDDEGIQLDFMSVLHGIPSFEGLRAVAVVVDFGGFPLRVAPLEAVIRSKKALGRPKDLAVTEILERTLREKEALEKETLAKGIPGGSGKGE